MEHWTDRYVAEQARQAAAVYSDPMITEYAEGDEVRDAMSAGYGFVVVRRGRDGRGAAIHPHALDVATCEALERRLVDVSRLWGIEYSCWTLSQWRAYVAAGRPRHRRAIATTSSRSIRFPTVATRRRVAAPELRRWRRPAHEDESLRPCRRARDVPRRSRTRRSWRTACRRAPRQLPCTP